MGYAHLTDGFAALDFPKNFGTWSASRKGKPLGKRGKWKKNAQGNLFLLLKSWTLGKFSGILGFYPKPHWGVAPNPKASLESWKGRSWENSWQEHVLVKNKSINTITSTEILLISKIKATVTNFKVKPTLTTLKNLKLVTGLLNVFESKQEHN